MKAVYYIALTMALAFLVVTGIAVIASGDTTNNVQVFRTLASSACWSLLAIAVKPKEAA